MCTGGEACVPVEQTRGRTEGYSLGGPLLPPSYSEPCQSQSLERAHLGSGRQAWRLDRGLSTWTTVDTYLPFKTQPGITSSRKSALTILSLSSKPPSLQ